MTLSQAITKIKSVNMSGLDSKMKEAVQSTLDVLMITENPDELKAAGFDDDIMKLAAKLTPTKRKATAKGRDMKAKATKANAKIKKAKASQKANAKPRPKKAKPTVATIAVKAETGSKSTAKPKATAKPKPTSKPKSEAKPKKEKVKAAPKPKKLTADEKAKEKAMAEIKKLDREITAYEKRISDTSGTVNRIAASFVDQSKSITNTLGALPDKLREELLMKRRKKAILARIIKRDAKYFINAAKTLKKSNQLPESLAADLESVATTLGSLNKKAAEKRKESPKKEKGFFARIFG